MSADVRVQVPIDDRLVVVAHLSDLAGIIRIAIDVGAGEGVLNGKSPDRCRQPRAS